MPYGSYKNALKKDIAQLRLWEENFPPNRLDIILEYSSRLKMNVIENLYEIGKILMQYCRETVSSAENQSTSTQDLVHELEVLLEKATIILSDEERSDSSSDESSSDESSSTIELEQNRYGRLHCYISCMIDLAPVIEKQISFLQYKMERQAPPLENVFHLSQSAQPFAMRIKDRFRDASISLVERLAQANWERSIRIRQQELEGLSAEDHHDAAALFQPYSVFHDSGLGTSIPTKSQYAVTNASHTSFLSAAGEESQGRPRVPPLPSEGEHGRYFQCTYCRKSISMKSRVEWKMHVFADLQSYICTHEKCKDPLKTFPSRKIWADHEFNKHFSQLQWRCFICHTTMVTQQSFVDHLTINHRIMMTGHRLAAVTSEAKETVLLLDFANHQCPLCSQTAWKTGKGYEIHVGQHLEEISLASIPIYEEYEDSDTDSNLDTSHNASMEGRRQQLAVQQARPQLSAQQQNSLTMVQANGMDKVSEDRQSSQVFPNKTHYTFPLLIRSSIGTQAEVLMPMTISAQEASGPPRPPLKNQQGQNRDETPQMTHVTPTMSQTIPIIRNITPTRRIRRRNSDSSMTQTPVMTHGIIDTPQTSNSLDLTPQEQQMLIQQGYLRHGQFTPQQIVQMQENACGQQNIQFHQQQMMQSNQAQQHQHQQLQQTMPFNAAQANGGHLHQDFQSIPMNQRYQQLYQQRLLRLRQEMAQRYMSEYGPPTQYPPQMAQQYGIGLERIAWNWLHELMRRERESSQRQQWQSMMDSGIGN